MYIPPNIHHQIKRGINAYFNGNLGDIFLCRKLQDYKFVWNFLVEMRANEEYDKLHLYMKRYWGRAFFQLGLEKGIIDEIVECIELMDSSKEKFCAKYETVLKRMEECSANRLSIAQWKRFSGLMTSNGLFRMGYICRNKCVDKIKTHSGNNGLFANFVVAMEEQEYERAGDILLKIRQNKLVQKWCEKSLDVFEDFYSIMTKQQERLIENYNSTTEFDKEYYDFINNNEVAIIGPSPAKIEEIQNMKNKIIIRFNDRGKSILAEEQKNISTQISFYNGGCSKWIKDNDNNSFLYDLKFIVCQEIVLDNFSDDIKGRIKIAKNLNALFLIGIPNALPFAMFDLIRCGKNSIEVYCSNLYLSKNVWSDKYNIHSKNEQEQMFWWPILAQHEMSTQFIFLKNMYKQGFIVPDEELKWVLEHDIRNYIAKMEELWVMDVIPYKINTKWEEKKN